MRKLSKVFKALSDTTRLRILKMLEVRALYVCEITEVASLSASAVSRHLSILRDTGLIVDSKEGKWVKYDLNREQNDDYVRHLLPLMRTWLPADATVVADQKRLQEISREMICKT